MKRENPQLAELVKRGILERVYTHPSDPSKNRYKMVDPEGVRKALEELGMLEQRKLN
jgi:hypothetical protein